MKTVNYIGLRETAAIIFVTKCNIADQLTCELFLEDLEFQFDYLPSLKKNDYIPRRRSFNSRDTKYWLWR